MSRQKLIDNNRLEAKRILIWLTFFTVFDLIFIVTGDERRLSSQKIFFVINFAIIIPIGFILMIMLIMNLSSSQKDLDGFTSDIPISILIVLVFNFLICLNITQNDRTGWAILTVMIYQTMFFYPLVLVLFLVYLWKRRKHKNYVKSGKISVELNAGTG